MIQPTPAFFIETLRGRGYRFIAPLQIQRQAYNADTVDSARLMHGSFVGRTAQLDCLRALFADACAGEPGIGNTTLVDQFSNP